MKSIPAHLWGRVPQARCAQHVSGTLSMPGLLARLCGWLPGMCPWVSMQEILDRIMGVVAFWMQTTVLTLALQALLLVLIHVMWISNAGEKRWKIPGCFKCARSFVLRTNSCFPLDWLSLPTCHCILQVQDWLQWWEDVASSEQQEKL